MPTHATFIFSAWRKPFPMATAGSLALEIMDSAPELFFLPRSLSLQLMS